MLTGSESGKYGAESGNNLIIICMQTHHMIGGSARCAGPLRAVGRMWIDVGMGYH